MSYLIELIQDFFHQGGGVLFIIFFTVLLMLYFILERFFYFKIEFPKVLKSSLEEWKGYPYKQTKLGNKILSLAVSELHASLEKNLSYIKTLIGVCPLMGLLGTVTGMISVFEVMAEVGTGNARLMAGGISMATIPTMAGMLSALVGLYFSNQLDYLVKIKKQKTKEMFIGA